MKTLPEEINKVIKMMDIIGIKIYQIEEPTLEDMTDKHKYELGGDEVVCFGVQAKSCDIFKGGIAYHREKIIYLGDDIGRRFFSDVCILIRHIMTEKYEEIISWDTKIKLAEVAGLEPEQLEKTPTNRPKM